MAIYSDLYSRRERSPQMVVNSKGILPQMAETFRLRIYNKLPRWDDMKMTFFFLPTVCFKIRDPFSPHILTFA